MIGGGVARFGVWPSGERNRNWSVSCTQDSDCCLWRGVQRSAPCPLARAARVVVTTVTSPLACRGGGGAWGGDWSV